MLGERLVFKPTREHQQEPAQLGLEPREVWLRSADGVALHGWFFSGSSDVVLVWFHGNRGNISDRLDQIRLLLDALGVSIFIFSYRGYGKSEGSPSERGVSRDALAAAEWVQGLPDAQEIIYFGRSMGCATAIETAGVVPPSKLILEAPFLSIRLMAEETPLGNLAGRFLRIRFDNLTKIGKLAVPLMVIHGDRDDTVPFSHGVQLFKAAPEPKEFYGVAGAGHSDCPVVGGERYFHRLRRFIGDAIGETGQGVR